MKKLMIAAAIVCAAAISQAAATKWSASTGYSAVTSDGYKNTGSGYTPAALSGATYYLIAVSSDTVGMGITQAKLLEAFRGESFNLADYAVTGSGTGTTKSDGKMPGANGIQAFTNEGDFTATQSYSFYLATIVNDGDQDWLYMTDAVPATAKASTSTASLTMAPGDTSKKNFGTGDYQGAGWYTAVPEPTSGLLLLLGVAGLALRRRRA